MKKIENIIAYRFMLKSPNAGINKERSRIHITVDSGVLTSDEYKKAKTLCRANMPMSLILPPRTLQSSEVEEGLWPCKKCLGVLIGARKPSSGL